MKSREAIHKHAKRFFQAVVLALVMLGAMLGTAAAVAGVTSPASGVAAVPAKGVVIPDGGNNSPTPTCQPGVICLAPSPTPCNPATGPCDTPTATPTRCDPSNGVPCDTAPSPRHPLRASNGSPATRLPYAHATGHVTRPHQSHWGLTRTVTRPRRHLVDTTGDCTVPLYSTEAIIDPTPTERRDYSTDTTDQILTPPTTARSVQNDLLTPQLGAVGCKLLPGHSHGTATASPVLCERLQDKAHSTHSNGDPTVLPLKTLLGPTLPRRNPTHALAGDTHQNARTAMLPNPVRHDPLVAAGRDNRQHRQ